MGRPHTSLLAVLVLAMVAGAAATCTLNTLVGSLPETMTVTNCVGCQLATTAAGTKDANNYLKQGYNYPAALGYGQQRLWFTTAGAIPTSTPGCTAAAGNGGFLAAFGAYTTWFSSAYDGNRPEKVAISDSYIKVFVNNGGYNALANPTSTKSTIYYSLCTVSTNGTATCPTYQSLGEFYVTDNPFILVTDLIDGEYLLKVYSTVTTCTSCPTVTSDSGTPLQIPFVVITSPPEPEITTTEVTYINADTKQGVLLFGSSTKSRWTGQNTDFAYSSSTTTLAVYHSFFQVKAPWAFSGWGSLIADNDDGKSMYAYNFGSTGTQGSWTFEVLNVLVSNYTTPGSVCSSAACSFSCPSMCLSDFSKLDTYNSDDGAYSAAPTTRTFIYDYQLPTISTTCKTGNCEGALYNRKTMEIEFSCTDNNAPCTFYCAIDGKPTLDPSKASSLSKGYTACSSPVTIHAKSSGSSTFTVYPVDAAGNVGDVSAPFTFYTDNTVPTVQFAGVAKRCLVDERYFIPDFTSSGPFTSSPSTATNPGAVGGICIPTSGSHGVAAASDTQPDTSISGQYGSTTCTCGTYSIATSSTTTVFTYNQGTYPSLMTADTDTSLSAYLGYYPKTVPDKGLDQVSQGLTGTQYLIDGVTTISDSDGSFDFTSNAGSQSNGFMLWDVGTASNNTDDISMTNYMYDTIVQVDTDITKEVYNLDADKYGAVLASKSVNGAYYYHVLQATNSPTATVNMQCQHPEILNCIQSSTNPFQMDCGMMIT
mmetsp:Transcript_12051/g.33881  ORF Transcript_12051/g.33881 Transcript_12051/m.33881 type:complete len:761 (+) Transcript_12051:279-2561(+)